MDTVNIQMNMDFNNNNIANMNNPYDMWSLSFIFFIILLNIFGITSIVINAETWENWF